MLDKKSIILHIANLLILYYKSISVFINAADVLGVGVHLIRDDGLFYAPLALEDAVDCNTCIITCLPTRAIRITPPTIAPIIIAQCVPEASGCVQALSTN